MLPHWNPDVARHYPSGHRHNPPEELHSPFYPLRGCYSSSNRSLLDEHMREMLGAGIGVAAVSWWGPYWREGTSDTQGVQTDKMLAEVLASAADTGMKIAFHLEPYPGRSAETVREDLQYLMERYAGHPAVYLIRGLPLYYVYDSYHIDAAHWATLLRTRGKHSIRGTALDGVFIALWLNGDDGPSIQRGGFDGFYTYFASSSASYGADPRNWATLGRFAHAHDLLFIPCVGPGYNDSRIRPWNAAATRDREGGARYTRLWREAIDAGGDVIAVTSYNEWGEGTQIEPASLQSDLHQKGYAQHEDYGSFTAPSLYMDLTKQMATLLQTSHHQQTPTDKADEL